MAEKTRIFKGCPGEVSAPDKPSTATCSEERVVELLIYALTITGPLPSRGLVSTTRTLAFALRLNPPPVPVMQVRSFSVPPASSVLPLVRLQLTQSSYRTSRCRSMPRFRVYGCAPTFPHGRVML